MQLREDVTRREGPWISLWITALASLATQLGLCQFFSFGERVPLSLDVDPSNLWKFAYHFPPKGEFLVNNWLGVPNPPVPLNPFGVAANLPVWWFFTIYAPVMATLALLAMAAFLRELELPRPAALAGGVLFAWQGDILSFVFPGHYGYIATWPFFALAAWGALRAQRTQQWAYALISGASCGTMVGLQPDRGAIASLLIAAFYLAPALRDAKVRWRQVGYLALCTAVALGVSLAAFLALFQNYIVGVKMGGEQSREETFKYVTQFSYSPEDSLTYFVPGIVGWHSNNANGPYWGKVGQWPGWEKERQGSRNLNLAITTTGTLSAMLAVLAAILLLPGQRMGPDSFSERQRFFGRLLLVLGLVTLVLAWGYHTPFYRTLFALPLMDKWRNPLKWLEITNFALVALSAYGVQFLIASLEVTAAENALVRRRLGWFMGVVTALLAFGLLASYPIGIGLATRLQNDGYAAYQVAEILQTLHISLLVALALMVALGVVLYAVWNPERLRACRLDNPLLNRGWQKMLTPSCLPLTLALAVATLSVLQLRWVAGQFIAPLRLEALTESNPLLEQLKTEGPRVRVSAAPQDPFLNVLMQNQFLADDISCLEISAASRIPDDFSAFLKTLEENRARLWLLAGVKHVAVPQQVVADLQRDPAIAANIDHADGYTLVPTKHDLPSHALVQMRDYLAKATFVPGAEVISDEAVMLKRLKDPAWNPRATVLLKSPAPVPEGKVEFNDELVHDSTEVTTYTRREIEIQAESMKGGYVLINDHYDPDWEVEVNGKRAPLLRADYLLRAVAVPPGAVKVQLHYVAHYRVAGLNLPAEAVNLFSDGVMIAAWLTAGVALWRRRKLSA